MSPKCIENVLDSFDFSVEYLTNYRSSNTEDRFSLQDYNKVIKTLLDNFYPGYDYDIPINHEYQSEAKARTRLSELNGTYKKSGGTVIANSHMLNKWHDNCKYITFTSLYPATIVKLFEMDKLYFNIKEFGILYKTLFKTKLLLKESFSEKNYLLLKILLNFTFGALNYKESKFITCNNPDLIPSYSASSFKFLNENEKDNIIYIDTDQIYLYEITNLVKHQLDYVLKLPYEVEDIHRMLVLVKKRYITIDKDGNIFSTGIRLFKRD